ncbi:MAG: phage head-tail connector protein [Hyphomonadaceae bacterium]|nr:phage head-tail connector protein [Hyphomonadaceae bacterium]
MTVSVVTPPASEPVSLAEAKLFLRIDHATEDGLIETLIGAARAAVEAGCGRVLITRRVRESLDIWRRDAAQGAILSSGPVTNVVAVRLLATNGAQSIIEADRYRLDGARDRPRLVFEAGLPATLRSVGGIEIEYDAGFAASAADLPVALRLATLTIVAALYEARQGDRLIPEAARALMRPFTPVRL